MFYSLLSIAGSMVCSGYALSLQIKGSGVQAWVGFATTISEIGYIQLPLVAILLKYC